jgi:hypothetical protein
MNINEAAEFMCWPRDVLKAAIEQGIELPKSKNLVKLRAIKLGDDYDIQETSLDEFIEQFEKEEPGRNPPTAVRRQLLVEARHRCAICKGTSAFEFHHIIEFSVLKHYDTNHMLLLCATCHRRCGNGEIDITAQREYKKQLTDTSNDFDSDLNNFPIRFSWDDLKDIVVEVHKVVKVANPSTVSKYDRRLIDLEKKNVLNKMGEDYFVMMRDKHQPYLGRIKEFLGNPANSSLAELYYETVDELNSKIAAERDKFNRFEDILIQVGDSAKTRLNGLRPTLNVFLTFMYFECDIGRKDDSAN